MNGYTLPQIQQQQGGGFGADTMGNLLQAMRMGQADREHAEALALTRQKQQALKDLFAQGGDPNSQGFINQAYAIDPALGGQLADNATAAGNLAARKNEAALAEGKARDDIIKTTEEKVKAVGENAVRAMAAGMPREQAEALFLPQAQHARDYLTARFPETKQFFDSNPLTLDHLTGAGAGADPKLKANEAELVEKAKYGARVPFEQQKADYEQANRVALANQNNTASMERAQVAADAKRAAVADKPLTESQGNATAFGLRAKQADADLNAMVSGGDYDPTSVLTGGYNTLAPNVMKTAQGQKYDSIVKNFITAVLRKESGASISEGEFANAYKVYIPQPGDSQAALDQKAKQRQQAIQALSIQAGPGAAHIGEGAPAAPAASGMSAMRSKILEGLKAGTLSREQALKLLGRTE